MKDCNFTGWFTEVYPGCELCPSEHYNSRLPEQVISLLVIHNISLPPEQFGGDKIQQFFQGNLDPSEHPYFEKIQQLTVSSHFLIDRSGKLIQFVNCNNRAWHAGASCYLGKQECNDFSIGIELEGSDNQPFTESQYLTLSMLSKQLMTFYPDIVAERIVGHSDIAAGRKTDPGPFFDWRLFNRLLYQD